MNKDDFWSWLRSIFIAVLIVSLVVGAVVGLNTVWKTHAERNCAELGDQIGYNTRVFSADCRIEVRPNLWVSEWDVAEFLPLIDCEKE